MQSGHQLAVTAALSAKVPRAAPFVVYAADSDDDGMVRVLWQLLKTEPVSSIALPKSSRPHRVTAELRCVDPDRGNALLHEP
jgi:hypothetical protein